MSNAVISITTQRLVEYTFFFCYVCFNSYDERNLNILEKRLRKLRNNSPFFEGKLKQIIKSGKKWTKEE